MRTFIYMARGRKGPKTTIICRVFFYRVNAGVQADTGEPKNLNFQPVIQQLNSMPFDAGAGRYLDSEDGRQLCCWSESSSYPFRIQMAYIRRGQHPPLESLGKLSPLNLPSGQGLAEITHLVVFKDGICGAEFNFYGPRASQLPYYFALKLSEICPAFRLATLLRPNLAARLAALSDITLLSLKVRASFSTILKQADEDLGAALEANKKAVNARPEDEIELIFKRKKNKNLESRSVPQKLLTAIRNLAIRPDLKEQVSIFKVDGETGSGSGILDILHEQFAERKEVQPALDETGGVDPISMYEVIEAAYSTFQEELASASEIE